MLAAATLLLSLAGFAPAGSADIRITVGNVAQETGEIFASLCNEDTYLAGRYDQCTNIRFAATEGGVGVFEGVPPGSYGISIFHDVDGDQRMKVGGQGIPLEPIGASNDARGLYGPPSFDDLAIEHGTEETRLTIALYRVAGR